MKREITITLEVDTADSLDEIRGDLCQEILGCSNFYSFIGIEEHIPPNIVRPIQEVPIDTEVYLFDEYDRMYIGTVVERNGELCRGKCIKGDVDSFYRTKIVKWANLFEPRGKQWRLKEK